ncbi:MAG: hydantoinase/oxoprolinase family protein [Pseudomonadota bacterium]|uniref:hydantoinase/oxoprolinase family protein n=1 Tax=Fodinicurvata fenggangensis TaxID=1121830 RepID=UPI0005551647|nr:hydantoinase/oxoprolinase family protein [Fodinicurvata fenggangensis]
MKTQQDGRHSVGIDIGGTFTDVVCVGDGRTHIFKLPSTRRNPSLAVEAAIRQLAEEHGVASEGIARFVHGTTVATNAVLERKGARIGLIATEGFSDVLEIGRQMRRQMYDLKIQPQTPGWLAPGVRRAEVSERVAADGSIVVPMDEKSLQAAVQKLLEQEVEAIAVSLLFSFANPSHERAVADYIHEVAPQLPVSLSSEVDPAFREYERTAVTAFDGYVKPVVDRYLENMETSLLQAKIPAPLQIMQSRGGLAASQVARQRPVRLFLSGPAAGVIGGSATARAAGFEDAITIDVGGTSSDIALIKSGEALVRSETTISGYAVRVPMVDIETLGAGGGSLVWLDAAKGLRVGPESAGSEPGPACYDRGGERPTVTDASVVLGYLDPAYFAGGTLTLKSELAEKAIREHVAEPMGLSVSAAALGIHRIANAQMAEGIRLVSLNRGHDPREFALVPLGGAGSLHAVPLAEELGLNRVLVPRYPGVLSAAGLLAAPVEHEVSSAFNKPLQEAGHEEVRNFLSELDRKTAELMAAESLEGLQTERRHLADVCYLGQSYTLEIPLDIENTEPFERLYRDFEDMHHRIYGHATGAGAKLVNLRSIHRAHLPSTDLALEAVEGVALKGQRSVWFQGSDMPQDAAVYDRSLLKQDDGPLRGPAVIEQSDTTVLVPPGWRGQLVEGEALLLEQEATA